MTAARPGPSGPPSSAERVICEMTDGTSERMIDRTHEWIDVLLLGPVPLDCVWE